MVWTKFLGKPSRVSSHDLVGRRLGEYMVLAHLGGGSFGKVYRAVHARSGMIVALKLLHRLGKTGINIATRIMGLILAATAAQFLIDGIRDGLRAPG